MALISLEHVTKTYDDKPVVNDLSLQVDQGELFVLVGTSGSGKTTTLKMINRLVDPTAGVIKFAGKPLMAYKVRDSRWDLGYVLQQIALFPTMTVAQNIAVIPEMKGWSRQKIRTATDDLLAMVDLPPDEYRDRMPSELSGGQQQRIGILRALASRPKVVLMDEPFSALDPISRTQLQDMLLHLHRAMKTTVVFVTHDMAEAMKLGDRIGVMHNGRLLQVDTPEAIATQPANDFVADLFKGAQANQGLQVTLSQLAPFAVEQSADHAVGGNLTLAEALPLLDAHETLRVKSDHGVFVIDTHSVVAYLASAFVDQDTETKG